MAQAKQDMGTGSIKKLMLQLMIPAVVAQVVNLLYNIVDRIYIGHIAGIGAAALTGVGLFTPILMLLNAFAMLVGAGGAPRTAIALGQGDRQQAEKIVSNSFTVLTDTKEMREALSSVLSVAPDDRVNLAFEDQKLVFRCSSDWGNASAGIDVIALTGSPTDSYWYSAKQLATCLKALGGTITLGIAQGGMLTISTQDAYYLQNVMRAPCG